MAIEYNLHYAKQKLQKVFEAERLNDLLAISKVVEFHPTDLFIRAGQIPQKFAIVLEGLFRYYYLDKMGNEFTKGFIKPPIVLSSYSAMLHQTSSYFFVQALEPSVILEIPYDRWLTLQEEHNYWDKFLIQALQKGYSIKEKRERELLLLDAEARYKIFLEEFSDIENRLSLQMIASYLGIKPETLSRIRKKMSA